MRALLLGLLYGATTTYGEIGRSLGITPRQVGALNAHNPISIVVPCHRVIGANGKLVGDAGGLDREQHLLELAGARAQPLLAAYPSGVDEDAASH
jgi:methylated-DNA-[protein]-cysteine S-methyltransferase